MSIADRLRPPGPPPAAAEMEDQALLALAQLRGRGQRRPPPKAAHFATNVIKPLFKGAGLSLAEIKRRWPEIIGEKLASATAPEKLASGALTIRTPSAMAPFVQHQLPLIIERCKLAGADVKKIVIVQGAPAPRAAPNVIKPRALTLEEEEALLRAVEHVDDPSLRRALMRLGRAVKAR